MGRRARAGGDRSCRLRRAGGRNVCLLWPYVGADLQRDLSHGHPVELDGRRESSTAPTWAPRARIGKNIGATGADVREKADLLAAQIPAPSAHFRAKFRTAIAPELTPLPGDPPEPINSQRCSSGAAAPTGIGMMSLESGASRCMGFPWSPSSVAMSLLAGRRHKHKSRGGRGPAPHPMQVREAFPNVSPEACVLEGRVASRVRPMVKRAAQDWDLEREGQEMRPLDKFWGP